MTNAAVVRLIVNADDFGYFDGMSEGILEAAQAGRVTAIGVMANGPALARHIDALAALPNAAVGVHLNATLGEPLTTAMAAHPVCAGGRLPTKERLALAVLCGRLDADLVVEEWRAQIERLRAVGLQLRFLNAHEHVHALPPLFRRVRALAQALGIPHVRLPRPEWRPKLGFATLARNLALAAVTPFDRVGSPETVAEPTFCGLNPSGRLDAAYCSWLLPRLEPGRTYELMCHPGRDDPAAAAQTSLRAYHDWEGELSFLLGDRFAELLRRYRVELVPFGSAAPVNAPTSTSVVTA